MGKKSRSKHAAGTSSASAAASTSGAIGTAPTGTSSLGTSAVERLGSDADTSIRLGELLDSIRCQAVLQRLKGSGYSENVAQRACLEVHQAKREVSYESCIKWIRRHDITKIDRPLQPLELLRYLSELVVSLVERLPQAEATQLQRQLESEPRSTGSVLAGGASCISEEATAQSVLAGQQVVAQSTGGCRPDALLLEQLDDGILCRLTAAGPAEVDLKALLRSLGACDEGGKAVSAVAVGTASAAAAVAAPSAAQPPAKALADCSSSSRSSSPAAALHLTERPKSAGHSEQEGSSSGGGSCGSGFTERVAQQVLGLQQHMSKALASLRRSSSTASTSTSQVFGSTLSAAAADAGMGADTASAVESLHDGQPLAEGSEAPVPHLSEEQLAALREMLGPGVEVCTAEQFKQQNPGADFDALPCLDLQALPATCAAGPQATAAGGAAAPGLEPQALAAELASLRAHQQWANELITQLIRRVGDAERPARQEAARLLQEVQTLRVEKEGMKSKLKELERSISRIKESSYLEAQQKRKLERQAAVAAAELEAASLREQEVAAEAAALQKQLAQERRRREGAEQRCKRNAADAAGVAAAAAAAAAEQLLGDLRQQLCRAREAAEQQRLTAERAEAAAAEPQASAAAAAKRESEVLAAEKASLLAALEEAQRHLQSAQQAHLEEEQARTALEAELEALRCRAETAEAAAAVLQQQLAAARVEAAAAEARAAAASAAVEVAQQQSAQLLAQQQQQQQQQRALLGASPGSASPSPEPLQPGLAAVPAATPVQAAPSLFGPHFDVWTAGRGAASTGSGTSLFGSSGQLDGSLDAAAAGHPGVPHALLHWASVSLGGSSGAPGSPLSHSGSGKPTPPHSMHSGSVANSPATHPAPMALLGGSVGAGQAAIAGAGPDASGSLFAGRGAGGGGGATDDSLIGSGDPGLFLPAATGIWSSHGAAFGGLPLFATQRH